jgi:RNA polymerase sigma factor (sigma-70 family)
MESAKIVATLARVLRDVGVAEDIAQDALVAAMEQWPHQGLPDKPAAWLMTTAKRRAIDHIRRDVNLARKLEQVGHLEEARAGEAAEAQLETAEQDISDDLLRLIFTACHPVLSRQAQVALTLRMLGGLTTSEIARAFLTSEATVGQRISRAKKTLQEAGVGFEAPAGEEVSARLAVVLEVVYLIFNEGYAATSGRDWVRADLCADAIRLGRILAGLAPAEPEVHGLLALMEIQASRNRARIASDGSPILLLDQDRSRWDWLLARAGLAELDRVMLLPGPPGPYVLQAAIAACHARAHTAEGTDWARIAALYGELARVHPSPVVELNRAVAVSYADGPAAALQIVERLADASELADYHLLPSVRGDLLARLGRAPEARAEFQRAAAMTDNEPERALLERRAAGLDRNSASAGSGGGGG